MLCDAQSLILLPAWADINASSTMLNHANKFGRLLHKFDDVRFNICLIFHDRL